LLSRLYPSVFKATLIFDSRVKTEATKPGPARW
jgi:hypothetical protein